MAKEVALKQENPITDVIPDFMREDMGKGTEAISASSVEVPRIKLIQAISPELTTFNDLKQGDFFHTILEKSIGQDVRICPIWTDERYILWRPQEDGGGILARADDGVHWRPANTEFTVRLKSGKQVTWRTATTVSQSRLDQWGTQDADNTESPPAATKMFNMVVSFPDLDIPPAVVTLQRSSVVVGKKFMGKLKITRTPSFGLIFKMRAVSDTNKAGQKFLNYSFTGDGVVTDRDFYTSNRDYYNMFKEQGLQIRDVETLQQEDSEGSTASDQPAGSPKF